MPENYLTVDQVRAVELDVSQNRAIVGGPGSGKTLVLLYRAALLSKQLGAPPDRYRMFVFTRVLRSYIASAARFLRIPDECICTFDSWCREYYLGNVGRRVPTIQSDRGRQPDFELIRREVLMHLQQKLMLPALYDFVLVDEAQDLDATALQILSLIARHVTVCIDQKQQIYEKGSSVDTINSILGIPKPSVSFLGAYRGCPYVARLASEFIDDAAERSQFLRQTKTVQEGRQVPVLYRARDGYDEKDRLIQVVKSRLNQGDRIAILFPSQRHVFGFATGLAEAGIEVETPDTIDFSTQKPKLMPYPSAKGLTVDSILMPRLINRGFGHMSEARITRWLFVGSSRASRWVFMSTTEADSLSALSRLEPLAAEGAIEVQVSSSANNDGGHHASGDVLGLSQSRLVDGQAVEKCAASDAQDDDGYGDLLDLL